MLNLEKVFARGSQNKLHILLFYSMDEYSEELKD